MDPVDKLVLILAVTISSVMLIILAGVVIRNEPLSPEGAKIFNNMTTTIIAILALYVGSKLKK